MNYWNAAAGVLSSVTLAVHLFAGGPEVHDPLLAAGPSVILQTYITVLWHAVSVILAINSLVLLAAARRTQMGPWPVWLVCAQYAAYAGLFIAYGSRNLGTLMETPQWIIFLLIAGLALCGTRRHLSGQGRATVSCG